MPAPGFEAQGHTATLQGNLVHHNIHVLHKNICSWISKHRDSALCISLAKVGYHNSAILALLLDWQRHAVKAGKNISVTHVPESLLSVMGLSGIQGLISQQ